jgi:hypothetical protein
MKKLTEYPQNLQKFKKDIRDGVYQCWYNPTRHFRSPSTVPDLESKNCKNVATHSSEFTRTFVIGTYRLRVPLCEEHRGYRI